jgi:glycosyltransferase involved in cell wall biosynthesis
MRIAYVSAYNAQDSRCYSGLGYNIAQALENQSIFLDYVCPLKEKYSLFFKGKKLFYEKFLKQTYLRDREPLILRAYAKQVEKKLSKLNTDLIFSPGTIPIADLECEQPIVFWTDSTFAGMIDFYPTYSNLSAETIRDGHAMETAALQKCQLAIYSSEWAANTAIEKYHVDKFKVKVVPFGANIECNKSLDEIRSMIASRPKDVCKLLFIGVDWFRKGGNIALEVAKELNKSGLKTELIIVGCKPIVNELLPSFVKYLGYISKATEAGQKKINNLITESHFLILPTTADCSPHVLAEANSFGVPCITTNIGGISTIIKTDINGIIFDKQAEIIDYCQYISTFFTNYKRYQELALSAFREYQLRLNWRVAGETVKQLLLEI